MNWTHSICISCWNEKNPDRPAVAMVNVEKETCCFCLKETQSGIYIRQDPRELSCTHKSD